MSSTSKGKAREREFCKLVNEFTKLEAMRVPLSGSLRYAGAEYKDDVVISDASGDQRVVRWRGEVKYRRNGEGFKTLLRWFEESDSANTSAVSLPAVAIPGYLVVRDTGFCAMLCKLHPEGKCHMCGMDAQGNYTVHRDGFSSGPEVDLCDGCGCSSGPSLASIWEGIQLPGFSVLDRTETTRPKTLDKWIDGADFLVLSKAYLGYQIVAIPTDSEPRDEHAAQLAAAAKYVLTG